MVSGGLAGVPDGLRPSPGQLPTGHEETEQGDPGGGALQGRCP